MNLRVLAVIGLAVALVGSVFAFLVSAAPPQPYNLWGIARQSDGATPIGQGTRITAWVDGVDYSNGTSVYDTAGRYDVDVFGNWVTQPGQPNTVEVKEGGDLGDETMIVAGDMTASGQVMTTKKFWTPGDVVNENIQLAAAANQPALLKIARITTRPADGLTGYVYICNPTASPVDSVSYYLHEDVPGSYNGFTQVLSGIINPGALLYVNLTGSLTMTVTGDNLKLVWDNAGPAFSATDIIIDRVEFNQTGGAGTLFWEPGNTLMTDAPAPGLGQEIRRSLACGDTNSNSADFTIAPETGRPGTNTAPTVTLTAPDGGQVWTGGTSHPITWTHTDVEDGSLSWTLSLSTNGGGSYPTLISSGGPSANGPNSFPWPVNTVDTTLARVQVCVSDSGGLPACDASATNFEIDSTRPTLTSTNPVNGATAVDPNADIMITFDEGMNRPATEGAVSFAPGPVTTTNTWAVNTLTLNPTTPLLGLTMYTVTVGCATLDDSDTGNQLAACPRQFSFTTAGGAIAPTVTLSSPNGAEIWSGASNHNIAWSMSDVDTVGNLQVDIHYSTDGGASYPPLNLVFSGSRGQGANTFGWTVPSINSNSVRVRVCASDGVLQTCTASAANFRIDSIRPTVVGRVPASGAANVLVGVNVVITFSESMARVPSEAAISITPAVSGILYSWSQTTVTDDTLTITHNAFATCTSYTVTVGTGARDLSDPGNGVLPADFWSFNTACAPTVSIAAPAGGEVWSGVSTHDVTFTTTDSDATLRVWVNLSTDGGANWAVLSGPSLRSTGTVTLPLPMPGTDTMNAQIRVTAQDSTSLDGVMTSPDFTIDAIAPTVSSTTPMQGAVDVAVTASIALTFSEAMDPTSTQSAIVLTPGAGSLSFNWNPAGDTVTITHAASLQVSTLYTLTVTTTAHDLSDPGNTLANPFTLTFTTSNVGAVSANAGGPYSVPAGTAILFDGRGSTGACAAPITCTWEVQLPSGLVFLSGAQPTFQTSVTGTFTVTLTVRDASNNEATDTTQVTVTAAQGGDFLSQYWWLILILILAIVGALLFLLMGKRRKKDEEMPEEVPPETVETVPPARPRAPPARPAAPPPKAAAPPRPVAPAVAAPAKGTPATKECATCGTIVDVTDTECFMCGSKL